MNFFARPHSIASASATYAPVIAAVRVPPSACSTSQSITIVFSPSALVSTTARSARPISREISCVRPPILPFTLSRSLRLLVARGSIAYSAVTQPLPLPVSQRGTPFVNDAVQSTFVPPNEMSAEPSACALQPRSMVMGRSWSSGAAVGAGDVGHGSPRVMRTAQVGAVGTAGAGQVDGAGLHQLHLA